MILLVITKCVVSRQLIKLNIMSDALSNWTGGLLEASEADEEMN